MPLSLGDYAVSESVDFHFTTHIADGTPTNLSGGSVSVYKSNSAAQSTAGITLTAPFDSIVGLNLIHIDTAFDETFYTTGNTFSVVLSAGTVGGVSVAGYVVGRFTLGRNILAPTGLDSIVIETSLNARQALSIIAAADSGDITAVDNSDGTWTFAIAGAGVATARIVALASTITKERDVTITPPT